jgi:hypothetical protein
MRLFPPHENLLALLDAVLEELLEERVSSSRGRKNSRAVKRKMSKFPTRHRNPQTGTVRCSPQVRVLSDPQCNGIGAHPVGQHPVYHEPGPPGPHRAEEAG